MKRIAGCNGMPPALKSYAATEWRLRCKLSRHPFQKSPATSLGRIPQPAEGEDRSFPKSRFRGTARAMVATGLNRAYRLGTSNKRSERFDLGILAPISLTPLPGCIVGRPQIPPPLQCSHSLSQRGAASQVRRPTSPNSAAASIEHRNLPKMHRVEAG